MPDKFIPTLPFHESEFPDDVVPGKKKTKPFPIIEVFGYDKHLVTEEARESFVQQHCPFSGEPCEKIIQYGYGYCSVQYKSQYDTNAEVYAVCDHRLDGAPVLHAVKDYFGDETDDVKIVSELKLSNPDQSFDFIAVDTNTEDFIAIETQAIDLRGGGVGPAWQSIVNGEPARWREYFSEEATKKKRRKDSVDYGVNMANITKRLGFQVADKGPLICGALMAKLYVVAQHRCFEYFCRRIPADWTTDREGEWDITFVTFDYTGIVLENGQQELAYVDTKRTTLASFSEALSRSTSNISRDEFLLKAMERVRKMK
jgi:hypothetical protein